MGAGEEPVPSTDNVAQFMYEVKNILKALGIFLIVKSLVELAVALVLMARERG